MDSEILKNVRPVSNLAFISKLIEKVVTNQMGVCMDVNKLYECMQSAYRKEYCTETALLHVQNNILRAVDEGCAVVLVLLNLIAAFDTVDHAVLISRSSARCGIKGKALVWLNHTLKIGLNVLAYRELSHPVIRSLDMVCHRAEYWVLNSLYILFHWEI